jgi:hypothetical protein
MTAQPGLFVVTRSSPICSYQTHCGGTVIDGAPVVVSATCTNTPFQCTRCGARGVESVSTSARVTKGRAT